MPIHPFSRPDNRFVIIADLGIDQLVIYQFDTVKRQTSPARIREHEARRGTEASYLSSERQIHVCRKRTR